MTNSEKLEKIGLAEVVKIQDKIIAVLEAVIEKSTISAALRPVIINFVRGFLRDADEKSLRESIEKVRDELIPWILSGSDTNEN